MTKQDEKEGIDVHEPPIAPRTVEREDRTRHPIALIMTIAFVGLVFVALAATVILAPTANAILAITRELMIYVAPIFTLILGFYFGKGK